MKQTAINAVQAWIAYDLPPAERDSLSPQLLESLYKRLDGEPEPVKAVTKKPKPKPVARKKK